MSFSLKKPAPEQKLRMSLFSARSPMNCLLAPSDSSSRRALDTPGALPKACLAKWFKYNLLQLLLLVALSPAAVMSQSPPITTGLIAHYTADLWSNNRWTDLSGAQNHVTKVGGSGSITVARPAGAVAYVQGPSTAWIFSTDRLVQLLCAIPLSCGLFIEVLPFDFFTSHDARWMFLFAGAFRSAAFALSMVLPEFDSLTCLRIFQETNKIILPRYRLTRSNRANKHLGYAGQIIIFVFVGFCCSSHVIAQNCPVNSNPASPCTGVFQIGSLQVPMLYMTEGSSAWVAVKYTTDTASAIEETTWKAANRNYYISRSTLLDCIANATDILMVESESAVFANMSNLAAFLKVRDNIQIGCAWFKDTHSDESTLVGWMSPYATAKYIPDARWIGCDGYQGLQNCHWKFVFNSCGNGQGSHSNLYNHWRFRGEGYDVTRSHSIWFRIPLSLLKQSPAPPITSGLVGYYTADSWTGTRWMDFSGAGNHVTEVGGSGSIAVARPAGAVAYVQGPSTAWIKFPTGILPSAQYTLFFVARYNGATRGRILQGLNSNWVFGFWGAKSGVAHHDTCSWITPYTSDLHGSDWVLGSDRSNSFRSNGVDRTISNGCQAFATLSINVGFPNGQGGIAQDFSDFAIHSILVYNVKLSDADVHTVEAFLTGDRSCAAGEAFSFSTLGCSPCAKGLYKNSSGALPCTPCPVGITTACEGSLSIASCSVIAPPVLPVWSTAQLSVSRFYLAATSVGSLALFAGGVASASLLRVYCWPMVACVSKIRTRCYVVFQLSWQIYATHSIHCR
jgi:hypothetical protein